MKETRFQPWLCSRCGYMMDAASHPEKDATPVEGDLSLCLNCGAHYSLHAGKWTPLTMAERAGLPPKLKAKMLLYEITRMQVVDRDLSKRPGQA